MDPNKKVRKNTKKDFDKLQEMILALSCRMPQHQAYVVAERYFKKYYGHRLYKNYQSYKASKYNRSIKKPVNQLVNYKKPT